VSKNISIFFNDDTRIEKSESLEQYYLGMCYSNGIGVEKTRLKPLPDCAKPQKSRRQRLHGKILRTHQSKRS